MPSNKIKFLRSLVLLVIIAVVFTKTALAITNDHARKSVDLEVNLRYHYDNVDSTSAKPNGECLSGSGDINNCDSSNRVTQDDSIDRPFEMEYRLKQIDRLFEEQQIPHPDLEAEGASTTLKQVLILHRHGDRTPVTFDPKDPLAKEPFWYFHGLGQLTNRGKARLYMLGKMMRARYNKFLVGKVNKNERVSRSSGVLRCIESAQTFLASFLGLNDSHSCDAPQLVWDRRSNILAQLWQPVNILSVPAKLDAMLAESAECQAFTNEQDNVIENSTEAQNLYDEYKFERDVLESTIGSKVNRYYKWTWVASLIEVERSYFADKMRPELFDIYDRVQEVGKKAMGLYAGTQKACRLRSGLLIGDMIKNMIQIRDGSNQQTRASSKVKKFVHYSAHDITIATLLNMLEAWNKFPVSPSYGANLVLELHHDNADKPSSSSDSDDSDNDKWFVRIFYMSSVPSASVEIHLPSCQPNDDPKSRCTLNKFKEIMQPYLIDTWQDWMKECGNDFGRLDPYGPAS